MVNTSPGPASSFASSGANRGLYWSASAGNRVANTSFAQPHSPSPDRKFIVRGNTRPTAGSLKRSRTSV